MSNQELPAFYYHFISYEMIGDIFLLIEALEYYYDSDGYTLGEEDRAVVVMSPQRTPEDIVATLLELRVLDHSAAMGFEVLHEIPKSLIINESNLDSALVRTYGTAFAKIVEEDKWVISTPNITPEGLKKHLFNAGIFFPESALKPEERSVPNPGFIITDEQPETPKE
ncbi:Hypothetical protein NCS54_01384100 [Fusarium falciforme]|uniref:Hypothetical protein n=1 Tax=Fusarium falciforme TaxID=195108 RepID=UPI002300737B|nr:Hypothetical protein NCS54_01384100 [Fusarium falciforme]WAO96177.1 Hypothetical protein NCS54_01384100 [Fusarium falciforme]